MLCNKDHQSAVSNSGNKRFKVSDIQSPPWTDNCCQFFIRLTMWNQTFQQLLTISEAIFVISSNRKWMRWTVTCNQSTDSCQKYMELKNTYAIINDYRNIIN